MIETFLQIEKKKMTLQEMCFSDQLSHGVDETLETHFAKSAPNDLAVPNSVSGDASPYLL